MSDFELNDFEIAHELYSRDERRVFHAVRRSDNANVRLTIFSPEMSQRADFRRALKMDRAMLSMMQHQSILRFLGSGESEGQLFFWTEVCGFEPLSAQCEQGRSFSCEDVIEIGWQICSALQHAHNLGMVHSGLSTDSVLLSDSLQVIVIDFGVARWLKAGQASDPADEKGPALITISATASRVEVEKDLADLASLLIRLIQNSSDAPESQESGRTTIKAALERLLARVTSSDPSQRPVSAREFQGRLGEILIGTDDDAMPLVDQRGAVSTSKRSIVVELFEPPESDSPLSPSKGESAGSASRVQILPILIGIAVIVVITLLAASLF